MASPQNTGDDEKQLEAGTDPVALADGNDTPALPEGYEVMVADEASMQEQLAESEEFGEELTSIRNLVQRYAQQMDQVGNDMKELRQSLQNMFDNDNDLQTLEEQAKTLTTDVKQKRQRIKESPEAVQLQMKVKELKEEQKEIQETLNNYLLRYYQLTGSKVIEDDSGAEREIRINARISKPKAA